MSHSDHLSGPPISSDRKEESEPEEAKVPSSSGVLEPVHLTKEEAHPPGNQASLPGRTGKGRCPPAQGMAPAAR